MTTKALITGGSGYFGSLLLKKLLERGYECTVLDINDADDRPEGVKFIKADIRNLEAVKKACQGIDIVHHNVAQVPLAKNPELFHSVNFDGTRNILEAALQNKVKKLIYTSSSAVYGVPEKSDLPITEESQPHPAEEYGKAKYEAEIICKDYIAKGLDVSIVRPRTILGHGRLGIFQILFDWVADGRHIPVLGSGNNIYQFVHADDLAEVCIRAGERSEPETFNCGASEYGSMREMLTYLCKHAGTGAKVISLPLKPAIFGMKVTAKLGLSPLGAYHHLMYAKDMFFSTEKIEKKLNYKAKYSNNQMITESYDDFINNKDTLLFVGEGKSLHKSAVKQGILRILKWML